MRALIRLLLFSLVCTGLLPGCSKKDQAKAANQAKAFDAAAPGLKAEWDKILAGAAADDYATAISTCRKLQARTDLSEEQRTAVNDTMTVVNDKMTTAAEKGDAKARRAIEDLRANW